MAKSLRSTGSLHRWRTRADPGRLRRNELLVGQHRDRSDAPPASYVRASAGASTSARSAPLAGDTPLDLGDDRDAAARRKAALKPRGGGAESRGRPTRQPGAGRRARRRPRRAYRSRIVVEDRSWHRPVLALARLCETRRGPRPAACAPRRSRSALRRRAPDPMLAARPADDSAAPALSTRRRARRPARPPAPPAQCRVASAVAARDARPRARAQPDILGRHCRTCANVAVRQLVDAAWGAEIEISSRPSCAVHHQRPLRAESAAALRPSRRDALDGHARQLAPWRRAGIGERPEQVEDGPDADLAARGHRVAHRRVVDAART